MSRPNPSVTLPSSGSNSSEPLRREQPSLGSNTNVIPTDTNARARILQRRDYCKNRIRELRGARDRGEAIAEEEAVAVMREYREIEIDLRLLSNLSSHPPPLPSRMSTNLLADPFTQDVANYQALEATRHNRSSYGSDLLNVVPPHARRGAMNHGQAQAFLSQLRPPVSGDSSTRQSQPSSDYLAGRMENVPSQDWHHRRMTSNSAYQSNPITMGTVNRPFIPPYPPYLLPTLPPVRSTSSSTYANPAYSTAPSGTSYRDLQAAYGYLHPAGNIPHLPHAREQVPPIPGYGASSVLQSSLRPLESYSSIDPGDIYDSSFLEDSWPPNLTYESIMEGGMPSRQTIQGFSTPTSQSRGVPAQGSSKEPRGLDVADGRPDAKTAEEMTVTLECKICFSQLASVVLIPCGESKFVSPIHAMASKAVHRTLRDVQMVRRPGCAQQQSDTASTFQAI